MNTLALCNPPAELLPPDQLGKAVEAELAGVADGEMQLSRGCARLAGLLAAVKTSFAWRDLGHASFNSYLLSIHERYGRSTQQLYSYVAVGERLLPLVGLAGLNKIGVTKAMEVVRAARRAKKSIPQEILDAAQSDAVGVNEIRALAHRVYELETQDQPKGSWLDIGGFYADDEQKKTFTDAVRITMKLLDLPQEMPEWLKRQRIILAWAQEFAGTHAAEVYGPGGAQ